jgi:hypothetical protein
MFLVPVVVRLLSKEHEKWILWLPFTWQLLFLAACAIAMASLIYSTSCPPIVRDHDRFDRFRASGLGSAYLLRSMAHVLRRAESSRDEAIAAHFLNKFTIQASPSKLLPKSLPDGQKAQIPSELLSEAFWLIRDLSDCHAPIRRLACCCCYFAGFFFSGIIALQIVYAVVRMSFGTQPLDG